MAKLISKTYGDALFETALEKGNVDELYEEVKTLRDILKENPDFESLMNNPRIMREEKEKLAESVFKGKLSDELTGLIILIISNRRYEFLEDVLDYFVNEVKEYKKIGVAYVKTPMELSGAQKKAVEEKLLSTTAYESMELNYEIDSSLIGGMVIRIGDRVVDSSVSAKLNALKKDLMNIQLKTAEDS
ncbi:MAG: F0F1 ATP synthase subunit delta [Lachnospiraceae bacterium]|nr:F0F1 ATP synthase subunit delta [Lachnospiraceae bacterium]